MPLTYKKLDAIEVKDGEVLQNDGAGFLMLFKKENSNEYVSYVRNRPGVNRTSKLLEDRGQAGIGGKYTGRKDDKKTPETRAERMFEELREECFGAFDDVKFTFVTNDAGEALCHEHPASKGFQYITAAVVANISAEEAQKRIDAINRTSELLFPFGDFLINKMTFDSYKTANGPAYSKEQAIADAQALMKTYDKMIEAAEASKTPFLQTLPKYAEKEMRLIAAGKSDLLNDLDKDIGPKTRRGLSFADGLLLTQASYGEPMIDANPLSNATESNGGGKLVNVRALQMGKGIWWNDDATAELLTEFLKPMPLQAITGVENNVTYPVRVEITNELTLPNMHMAGKAYQGYEASNLMPDGVNVKLVFHTSDTNETLVLGYDRNNPGLDNTQPMQTSSSIGGGFNLDRTGKFVEQVVNQVKNKAQYTHADGEQKVVLDNLTNTIEDAQGWESVVVSHTNSEWKMNMLTATKHISCTKAELDNTVKTLKDVREQAKGKAVPEKFLVTNYSTYSQERISSASVNASTRTEQEKAATGGHRVFNDYFEGTRAWNNAHIQSPTPSVLKNSATKTIELKA